MTTLVILFNLKPGVDVDAYEAWARETDLPLVRNLASCAGFESLRVRSLFGSDAAAPYQYVEVIRITDVEDFRHDLASDAVQAVADQFANFAADPVFMLTDSIES